MNILVLFISSGISLAVLIVHSYLSRGMRITLNFFVFAFIWAFGKEGAVRKEKIYELYPYLKLYDFPDIVPVFIASLTATIGWVFTFYMSWCIAERILIRLDYFKNKVFAVLLMSSFVIIGISYAIEVTAMNIGWWYWKIQPLAYKDLFVGGYSLLTIGAWLFFSISFLIAFLLMECSKYRRSSWKCVFVFIPFIYGWTIHYLGPRVPTAPIGAVNVLGGFILSILFLAVLSKVSFEAGFIDYNIHFNKLSKIRFFLLDNTPILMFLLMISIVIIAIICVINKPILLISIMPLLFILLLSIKRVPLQVIISIALMAVILDRLRLRSIITILPLLFFLILWAFIKIKGYILKE